MPWVKTNPNPKNREGFDCVVRAIGIAMHRSWYDIYDELCAMGREDCDMPSVDSIWGHWLLLHGCKPFKLPESCPECVTVKMFCRMYPYGVYVIGTGSHAVAVVNGNYYDSWDSGNVIPSFFWQIG